MQLLLQMPAGSPDWNDGREQRLMLSMLFATAIVAALLSVVRMPVVPDMAPLTDLLVRLVGESPVADRTEPPPAEFHESIEEPALAPGALEKPAPGAEPADTAVAPGPDWAILGNEAITDYLDGLENPASPNPVMDARRRAFGDRYQPPMHERPKPIWENVEQDQLGRSVLRSGNCYRVIDDPNVGSRWQFEQFGQYITMCTFYRRLPKELPWVAEIRDRYQYLKYPDGIVPEPLEGQ